MSANEIEGKTYDVKCISANEIEGKTYDVTCISANEIEGKTYDVNCISANHHHVVSSNYLLPSLCACLSCIVEL